MTSNDTSAPLSTATLPKPYYADDTVKLFHGDALELMAGCQADLLLTDPPYNAGKRYGVHDDAMTPEAYAEWTERWFAASRFQTTRQAVFPGVGNLDMWLRLFPTKSLSAWFKPGNPAGGGPFNFCEWEPILLYNPGWVGGSDVFRATVNKQADTGDHPCPKPLSLFRALIQRLKGVTVLDPFCGSGTTLRAAKDLGVQAIGLEIEERFCEIAARRLAQEVLAL